VSEQEAVVCALYQTMERWPDPWERVSPPVKDAWRGRTDTLLNALAASGYVVASEADLDAYAVARRFPRHAVEQLRVAAENYLSATNGCQNVNYSRRELINALTVLSNVPKELAAHLAEEKVS
jgi:hypothetical protein